MSWNFADAHHVLCDVREVGRVDADAVEEGGPCLVCFAFAQRDGPVLKMPVSMGTSKLLVPVRR